VIEPFDMTGLERGPDGVKRYKGLHASVVAMLRASADIYGQCEAFVDFATARRPSYREVWDAAARVAGGLRSDGVVKGDRVAIRYENGIEWVYCFLGTLLAGGVAVPVNTRFTESEAAYVVQDSGAKVVLAPESPLPDGNPFADDALSHDDLGALFYTSGTTGFPKGAVTTHGNLLSGVENILRARSLRDESSPIRTLVSVPLFHVTACSAQLLPTLFKGGCSVILPRFEVGPFLEAIVEEHVGVVSTVPAVLWKVLSDPRMSAAAMVHVTHVTYGGAPVPPDLVGRIQEGFPNARLGHGFGMTEASAAVTTLPHEFASHVDSVGFAVPSVDLAVLDPDPVTGAGELLVRGPNVVVGYWNSPEATAAAFVDGWLHTGDVARITPEGFTYILDRIKDMINRGGENIYSVEVENALAAAPGVFEVAVVAVPDAMMGEKVGAAFVPLPGQTLDIDAVMASAGAGLADFKVPEFIYVSEDPLPRNPAGKVMKNAIREHARWSAVARPRRA
jgi:acyl-CoA synthetase (AMP-forming)/AMP-acid ligase II